jgi:predicted acyl esterase
VTSILIDKDAMLPMRDGVRLASDVYRLQDAPRAPALLTRTPYDKNKPSAAVPASPSTSCERSNLATWS